MANTIILILKMENWGTWRFSSFAKVIELDQECEPRQSDSRTYVLIIYTEMSNIWASLMDQQVKNLPANARDEGDEVQSLGQEDLLEEEMATHSSILAWRIP